MVNRGFHPLNPRRQARYRQFPRRAIRFMPPVVLRIRFSSAVFDVIILNARAGGYKLADYHVFLSRQRTNLALNRGVRQHPRRLLERRGRQERIRRERCTVIPSSVGEYWASLNPSPGFNPLPYLLILFEKLKFIHKRAKQQIVSPGSSTLTLRIICRIIISICLSLISIAFCL